MIEPNGPWFTCLPSCETEVPCGTGRHTVRWEAGSLRLASHADPEGELVLAALGGEKARCVELAEAWARHADDLSVLAIGPRGPADTIAVGWEDVLAAAQAGQGSVWPGRYSGAGGAGLAGGAGGAGLVGGAGGPQPGGTQPGGPMRLASQPGPTMARASARQRQLQEEVLAVQRRRNDILSLLALGYGFQVRLIGQVAAAHATRADGEQGRPALVAAISGRLAPVAEEWLGIDPHQVEVSLHQRPSWGSTELTGYGAARRLRVSLPAGWLASVWACGLARVGRYLIVAVDQPGWPDARVLGLRSPGTKPEELDVHADPDGPVDVPHWTI